MKHEDKLGTLEEAIEFDKKRNYQYTELSDEEIEHIYTKICLEDKNQITTRFARAILKKAREL
jgi:hypothetical protein